MPKNPKACAGDLTKEPHQFETTSGETIESELGTLTVSENREKAGSSLIDLVFLRLKARTSQPLSPIVFLSGGPGDSGIHWAKYPQFLKAFQRLQDVADVILLDQRGCGRSEADLSMPMPADVPEDALLSRDAMLKTLVDQGEANVNRFLNKGIDLTSYNPIDSSDDLASLRDSLGVKKLNLIGYSYGSHLSLTTIRRHSSIIDKVVLCGFEGPNDTLKLPSNVQNQLVKLSKLWLMQGGSQNLLEMIERVHDSIENQPIEIDVEIPKLNRKCRLHIGKFGLQVIAASWMGVSNRFHSLPLLYGSILKGDTEELESAVQKYVRGWSRSATFYLTDGASLATPARLQQIAAEAPRCLLGDAVNFPFPEINATYKPRDLGADFREPVTSDIPVLSITGSLDGNTPTEQALEQLTRFPNSRHHLIENAAHNDMLLPSDVHDAIVDFLISGTTKHLKSTMPVPKFKPID